MLRTPGSAEAGAFLVGRGSDGISFDADPLPQFFEPGSGVGAMNDAALKPQPFGNVVAIVPNVVFGY